MAEIVTDYRAVREKKGRGREREGKREKDGCPSQDGRMTDRPTDRHTHTHFGHNM